MLEFLPRLIELILIVWIVRFLLRNLFGTGTPGRGFNASAGGGQAFTAHRSHAEPPVVSGGEMKKDPQCGTYVSTELSIKVRSGGEVLHFCSRECQEEYMQAHSSKPA